MRKSISNSQVQSYIVYLYKIYKKKTIRNMKKTFGVTLTRFNLPGLTNTNGRFIRVIDVYINFMFENFRRQNI